MIERARPAAHVRRASSSASRVIARIRHAGGQSIQEAVWLPIPRARGVEYRCEYRDPCHPGRCTATRRRPGPAPGGKVPGLSAVGAVHHPGGVMAAPADGTGDSKAFGLVV